MEFISIQLDICPDEVCLLCGTALMHNSWLWYVGGWVQAIPVMVQCTLVWALLTHTKVPNL